MGLFGFGEKTIVLTVVLFAIWIIVLNARAGVREISRSLVEMAHSFGATSLQLFFKIYIWAVLPEIALVLVNSLSFIQPDFMEHFWALNFIILAFAFPLNEALVWLQNSISYYASTRD